MRLSVLVPAALFGLLPLGCGGSEPDPNDPSQMQGQYGASGQYPPGQYNPGGTGQYPPGQQPGQPGAPPPGTAPPAGTAPASGGSQATPIAAGALATPLLTPLAASEAPGMQPDGSAFAGQFQEGQTMEQALTLQPGKCYTVIAVGTGITELDAMIAAQPLPNLPPAPLSQDDRSGAQAVVAGKGSCYKNIAPLAIPGKVIVKATRGAGMAAAQVYVK